MSERIDTPLTAEHFVEWCKSMLGQPYWYGTTVAKCTEDLLKRKTAQYPAHYGANRYSRYKADIAAGKVCADCVGACKGYAWTNGGTEKMSYQSRNCPDKSANGMFDYAKAKGCEWGVIGTIPNIPGIAVRFDGHVGYYIGDGYVIEWRGFAYGCVKTKLGSRAWTHWYKLPWIDYADNALIDECPYAVPSRTLRKGFVGDDVKWVQWQLVRLGYDIGADGIDGDFGKNTENAVKAFQGVAGLEVDGIVGKLTRAALKAA